uniref:Uncharacterized protein n=1 Tax=Eutreptiella gymnastica TaxID=73025 RepID=A0A7S1NE41_9EUGL
MFQPLWVQASTCMGPFPSQDCVSQCLVQAASATGCTHPSFSLAACRLPAPHIGGASTAGPHCYCSLAQRCCSILEMLPLLSWALMPVCTPRALPAPSVDAAANPVPYAFATCVAAVAWAHPVFGQEPETHIEAAHLLLPS